MNILTNNKLIINQYQAHIHLMPQILLLEPNDL